MKHQESDGSPTRQRHEGMSLLGRGLISGAADDDPSAIGTYASAGARFGLGMLWTAPVTLPMMFTVVYLSSKLGQVTGRGLFQVIHDNYPRWFLYLALAGVVIGNTIEAAADLGGMAAAVNLFVPLSVPLIVAVMAVILLCLQVMGSYTFIRRIFRWLALSLLAYTGAAILAKPDWMAVLKGSLIPSIEFNEEFLSIIVAIIGTTLSAYLYTWQSNEEVEEKIAEGKTSMKARRGVSSSKLARSRKEILVGMTFSNLVMYFIIMATGATLHVQGHTDIQTAAQAAEALKPIAGQAAGYLFAAGIISVGFLAVPVMTTGAAYDLAQSIGIKGSLNASAPEAPGFYVIIAAVTLIAVAMNFIGINPMKALVWSGVVQGFSTPPLLLLLLFMTNNKAIMGEHVNSRLMNVAGWLTVLAIFSASAGLVVTWII
ncbi:NRAMP (natural resistance-associated macrophage protein)-like metal ion transporter [Rhizobium sp. ERR 922]|nr:NRAMP (natural resistance-associated macrophage protein)-like metal ion transporter [Rhizobium sp. ERR 922]TWB90192.1 NRAMP (natural resistance-associated macrophage protein)-like metal ion transporter [Rhizobium sp. ERR 942]